MSAYIVGVEQIDGVANEQHELAMSEVEDSRHTGGDPRCQHDEHDNRAEAQNLEGRALARLNPSSMLTAPASLRADARLRPTNLSSGQRPAPGMRSVAGLLRFRQLA